MHTRVENEVHSNTALIIRLSLQKKKEKKNCAVQIFCVLYLGAKGKVHVGWRKRTGVSRHYVRPTTSLTASQTNTT